MAPRFGFAYTVHPGTVIRGGYGIGFVPMNTTSTANMKNDPFVSSYLCVFCAAKFATGLPAITASNIDDASAYIPDGVDPKFRSSYLQQFNLTVQKDFAGNVLTASYVGILGRHMAQILTDLNAPPPNASSNPNSLRPYYKQHPNLGNIGFMRSEGTSVYNSFQAALNGVSRMASSSTPTTVSLTNSTTLPTSMGLAAAGTVSFPAGSKNWTGATAPSTFATASPELRITNSPLERTARGFGGC